MKRLARKQILAMHTELIAEHGGMDGLRDEALFDSISNSKLPPCNFELVGCGEARLALPPETLRVSSATSMSRIPIPDRITTHSIWNWNESALEAPFHGFGGQELFPTVQQKAVRLGYGL